MQNEKLPTLFLSHGSPTLYFDNVPAREFIRNLGKEIKRPKAILVVSAHWETEVPTINAVDMNDTIHDFYGFPKQMYELQYPAKGSKELAQRVHELLSESGVRTEIDQKRGLDHGAYIPLLLMYPEADIPVVQLSIQPHLGTGHHLEIGRAIQKLREEGVLIIASGSFTHNLRALKWADGPNGDSHEAWTSEFSDWFNHALQDGKTCDLLAYRRLAPHAQMAHPHDEHLLPIYVALGAAYPNYTATQIHQSVTFGNLRMDSYRFD